jgi:2-isopropylmalate synthase
MTQPEKLRVAKALAELGVDVIEAGFPIASKGDWESVNLVAREVRGPIIAGLARCNRDDIDAAWRPLKDAARPASCLSRHQRDSSRTQTQHGEGTDGCARYRL